ncbi:hypothetical protein CAOG_00741 [Capsaspora owczarzaki ATCC 30864]|uniref:ARID domain-containing protein n=1 Tax=Capsaspora owczarzaki (strain ATCC 30864) TaxID=595528 RepID=A0A0D2VH27_CAPO3|nr:hypothetical protein CAOG_00741 [Capsaspora owczarzaki ATCC 30864]KJE89227.1 hypothetical protein CAOG_000741 [Capsaspora owczarzaki ATCC 30864]|eukprot:XP_004365612.1 hypothetical protein CAOG_00741 [Capsaspora owczarzaki ATCC 30864]
MSRIPNPALVGSDEFVEDLRTFQSRRSNPPLKVPKAGGHELDLYKLYLAVTAHGGFESVTGLKLWREIGREIDLPGTVTNSPFVLKMYYAKLLIEYELVNYYGRPIDSIPWQDWNKPLRDVNDISVAVAHATGRMAPVPGGAYMVETPLDPISFIDWRKLPPFMLAGNPDAVGHAVTPLRAFQPRATMATAVSRTGAGNPTSASAAASAATASAAFVLPSPAHHHHASALSATGSHAADRTLSPLPGRQTPNSHIQQHLHGDTSMAGFAADVNAESYHPFISGFDALQALDRYAFTPSSRLAPLVVAGTKASTSTSSSSSSSGSSLHKPKPRLSLPQLAPQEQQHAQQQLVQNDPSFKFLSLFPSDTSAPVVGYEQLHHLEKSGCRMRVLQALQSTLPNEIDWAFNVLVVMSHDVCDVTLDICPATVPGLIELVLQQVEFLVQQAPSYVDTKLAALDKLRAAGTVKDEPPSTSDTTLAGGGGDNGDGENKRHETRRRRRVPSAVDDISSSFADIARAFAPSQDCRAVPLTSGSRRWRSSDMEPADEESARKRIALARDDDASPPLLTASSVSPALSLAQMERVSQVLLIVHNWAQDALNMTAFGNAAAVIQPFLERCILFEQRQEWRQQAFDILVTVARVSQLSSVADSATTTKANPGGDNFSAFLKRYLVDSIMSSDRSRVLFALDCTANLAAASAGANTKFILNICTDHFLRRAVTLLLVPDVQVVLASLEALYQLTQLDQSINSALAYHPGAVRLLVTLLSFEHDMTHEVSKPHTHASSSSNHGRLAAEKYASKWIKTHLRLSGTSISEPTVTPQQVYAEYADHCRRHDKPLVDSFELSQAVRDLLKATVTLAIGPSGHVEPYFLGVKRHAVPLPIESIEPPAHSVTAIVAGAESRANTRPALNAVHMHISLAASALELAPHAAHDNAPLEPIAAGVRFAAGLVLKNFVLEPANHAALSPCIPDIVGHCLNDHHVSGVLASLLSDFNVAAH